MNNEMRKAFEKEVLVKKGSVQILDNGEYYIPTIQVYWTTWQAACKWMQEEQIKRDAEICDKNTKKFPACICAELIRNQEKV